MEFPLFDDGTVIKQGSGEIIAYLLSGHEMEACVTRSDMLHGNISGLYLSQCPDGQEDNFVTLADRLAKGACTSGFRAMDASPNCWSAFCKSGR